MAVAVQTKTERDPSKFAYATNMGNSDYWEWRMRFGDSLFQLSSRLQRSNDAWTRVLLSWVGFSFMMFSHAPLWKIHFFASSVITLTRIRDKGVEPTIDEVHVLDTVFANEKLRALFTPETYHILDYDQEFEPDTSNPLFPEYRTSLAKFFNVDSNTTVGKYKFGDVESGATMTLHFKTMPFSNNKYNFSEPFMIYDMWAEVSHNGEVFTEHLVKAEETLKTKKIFVVLH